MEDLKPFEKLLEPDVRWAHFVRVDAMTGLFRPISLEDRYQEIADISLSVASPEDIRSQFNVALMLGIYAWLYYPFHQIAELKAYSTVEMALRHRFPEDKGSFKMRLTLAIERGDIGDYGFSRIIPDGANPTQYVCKLPNIIPELRNDLAHGSTTLHPHSLSTLRKCAEIINQLYRERE